MRPLFDENQQLDETELVDSLANKAPSNHKAVLISQVFSPEIGDLPTFVEHYKRANTIDNIAMANFSSSDEDSYTKRHKKRSKFKEHEESGNTRQNKNSSIYCSRHGENKSHTSRECKFLKKKSKDKDNHKYGKSITKISSNNLFL